MRNRLLAGPVLAVVIFITWQASADAPALYTAAQASTGAALFSQNCASCHGVSLEGVAGPALKGSAFYQMAAAQSLNVASLLTVVSQSMPQDNPGTLSPAQYAALIAYILQQNGYAAGSVELSADNANLKDVSLSK